MREETNIEEKRIVDWVLVICLRSLQSIQMIDKVKKKERSLEKGWNQ